MNGPRSLRIKSILAIFTLFLRVLLGGILILAGVTKVNDISHFRDIILNYQIIPPFLVNIMAIILPWLEIFVGVALLTKFLFRGGLILALFLYFSFFLVITYAYAKGLDIECGCFGRTIRESVSLRKILENLLYLLGSLTLIFIQFRKTGK